MGFNTNFWAGSDLHTTGFRSGFFRFTERLFRQSFQQPDLREHLDLGHPFQDFQPVLLFLG